MSSLGDSIEKLEKSLINLENAIKEFRISLKEFLTTFFSIIMGKAEQLALPEKEIKFPREFMGLVDDLLALLDSNMPAQVIGDVLKNTFEIFKEKVPQHPIYPRIQEAITLLYSYSVGVLLTEEDKEKIRALLNDLKAIIE